MLSAIHLVRLYHYGLKMSNKKSFKFYHNKVCLTNCLDYNYFLVYFFIFKTMKCLQPQASLTFSIREKINHWSCKILTLIKYLPQSGPGALSLKEGITKPLLSKKFFTMHLQQNKNLNGCSYFPESFNIYSTKKNVTLFTFWKVVLVILETFEKC